MRVISQGHGVILPHSFSQLSLLLTTLPQGHGVTLSPSFSQLNLSFFLQPSLPPQYHYPPYLPTPRDEFGRDRIRLHTVAFGPPDEDYQVLHKRE